MKKLAIILAALFFCLDASAKEAAVTYSPVVGKTYPTKLLWGDTHLHTNNSADSFTFANKSLTAEDAYKFARGEEVNSQFGLPAKLRVPLDFLVVADHAEFLGIFSLLDAEAPEFLRTKLGKYWHENIKAGRWNIVLKDFVRALRGEEWDFEVDKEIAVSVWNEVARVADQYNEPGRFTTFSGFEWSSMPDGNNLHRVVMFKDSAEMVTQVLPFSAIDSSDPEDLWQYLQDYENTSGGEALAIPHNPNVSNGLMFSSKKMDGNKLDSVYASLRSRWEPILEVTQTKGDSEAHPFLSPNDEFADYETWDSVNIDGSTVKENWMLKYEYARSALKMGLEYQNSLKANPFEFGMIGSTDSHTSLATAEEDNWYGKFPLERPGPDRATGKNPPFYDYWRLGAAGYAAVWAHENSRESIFAAMKRKEVYASTGPRIVLRMFAGWGFLPDDVYAHDYVDIGYSQGVSMGSKLDEIQSPNGVPRFMVTAVKDPNGANLDRIQIIKGWLDGDGVAQEKIYNIAVSDQKRINKENGEVQPVGNTVIVSEASYSNKIGAAQLIAYWRDPDFLKDSGAFYYVRVLEIPTPRWTAYDAKKFTQDLPDEIQTWQQERAYSSPIWYKP
ncbi:MAG: DUF3604 domain-containing protein [Gammaproteobacteria bacterium]|nr:DUF3604 domain-containing protein [Gammaproteobacteria bacterium]